MFYQIKMRLCSVLFVFILCSNLGSESYAAPVKSKHQVNAAGLGKHLDATGRGYVFTGKPATRDLSFITTIRRSVKNKKKPVVLLRSSWNDMNIGDIGHTPGTLRLLERYYPEAEIILWHAQPRPVTEAIVTKNFPKVKIVRGAFPLQNDSMPAELKEAFARADIYLHNSGMSFNFGLFNSDLSTIITNLSPFLYCIEQKIPFGLYGQSFDRFDAPALPFYRDVFNRAAFIYCRDSESLKYLKENNFKTPVLEFGPDGCFGIDVRDEEKGLAYLEESGLEENKFLVVLIRTNTPHPYAAKDNALNPANITPELKREDSLRIGKVIEVINHWVRSTGYKVLLAPESFKEMLSARSMIYEKLSPEVQGKVVCRDKFWSADEAMSVYARAHTLFGLEPHSLIMGLALGKPIIHARAIKYGKKAWMFRDIGLGEWLFDIDQTTSATLNKTILEIYNDYPKALRKVQTAMAGVANKQKISMDVVKKVRARNSGNNPAKQG